MDTKTATGRISYLGLYCQPITLISKLMHTLNIHDCIWPQRQPNSHKGQHGKLAIIGGAEGMLGAALLAARAGLLAGAGRTYLAFLHPQAPQIDIEFPELMIRSPDQVFAPDSLDSLAIGPGMGQSSYAKQLLTQALSSKIPLVLDADALNIIAQANQDGDETLMRLMRQCSASHVITPHVGEAARLLDCDTQQIQAQREQSAINLAQRYHAVCMLKGAHSVIAQPDAHYVINPTGNAGLASGGTGDVLCGVVASLIAQGLSAWQAATTASFVHGLAADQLLTQGVGPIGMRASEVALQIRSILNHHG